MSLLSKLVYDYNFIGIHDIKDKYVIDKRIDITKNITVDFIQKKNIYFNLFQYVTYLTNKDFLQNSENYLELLEKYFPNTEIYGYFHNKNRLHSLILLNHKTYEIIVVFRGSQYIDEWIKNLYFMEKEISFNKEYKIHNGIYNMYINDDIDKNIIYILEILYIFYPKYRKVITGHSKGSTNCILLATELLSKLNEKYDYEIFIFGSPQILNYKYASYIHNHKNIKIYNIMNSYDIITIFPFNKYQIGKQILLTDNKMIVNEYENPYKIKFNLFGKIYSSISNHDLNIYIKKIFELL
jgi:hypothetical protein